MMFVQDVDVMNVNDIYEGWGWLDWSGKEIVPSVKPGDEYGTFVVYHQIQLQHLVQGHEKAAGSKGVLKDMGMSNGTWHGDGIGRACPCSLCR